jgi:signal transduction histidine kinase
LGKIRTSSDHLLELINDILEMSRIESGRLNLEYAPTDLRGVFEGVGDLFSEQMSQKGIDFSVHTGRLRDRFVWCDRKNPNRVLLNLVGNSYKFTPSGGTVTCSVAQLADDAGLGSYEIRVQDSGIGMSKEFVD